MVLVLLCGVSGKLTKIGNDDDKNDDDRSDWSGSIGDGVEGGGDCQWWLCSLLDRDDDDELWMGGLLPCKIYEK